LKIQQLQLEQRLKESQRGAQEASEKIEVTLGAGIVTAWRVDSYLTRKGL
jgi:hypothetical protein